MGRTILLSADGSQQGSFLSRLSQRTIAQRMGESQPVIARLEKPFEPTWRQPSLSVVSW